MSNPEPNVLILDAKIQRQRLRDMKTAAKRRKITTSDIFSSVVTHIVTEFDTIEAVLRKLDLPNTEDLGGTKVVKVAWFTDCMRAGHVVDVLEEYKVPSSRTDEFNTRTALRSEPSRPWLTDYACQRATPLKHFNTKFTKALEILQEHAELRDTDQDYSRALAFRRASCVLKSMPFCITSMGQLRNVLNIGDHSRRVIQAILEDGECPEVEDIRSSSWFQKMRLFSGVFGVGPSTAKKWIEKGWTTIKEAQQDHLSGDWRVNWGLGFHDDLDTPVSQSEAVYIKNLVQLKLNKILPGGIMEVTGGFRRGKPSGHDVDILISHPEEGREIGILTRLLWQLQSEGVVLCGKLEKSTFKPEVLYTDFKVSMRGQLDHFEKWIGIFKVPKSASNSHRSDTDVSVLCDKGMIAKDGGKSCSENGRDETHNENKMSVNFLPKTSKEDNENGFKHSDNRDQNLDQSMEDYETCAKKQRKCEDSELSPLELSQQCRDWVARRVDLIISPYSQYYYALVGWTGNKQFNRDLRTYCKKELGMHLTSHGLYDMKKSESIPACSEEEVFKNLKLTYREPVYRNC